MKSLLMGIAGAVISLSSPCDAEELRPFPQHTVYTAGTIKPSVKNQAVLDAQVLEFYKLWKQKYLHPTGSDQLYVFANAEKTFGKETRSVSEGHGYGMVAVVLMAGKHSDPDAHSEFDALYRFFRAHPTSTHADLMSWQQTAKGDSDILTEKKNDLDSATDGDMDIAYALLLADRQWGSRGKINYKKEALKVIEAIRDGETDSEQHTLGLGDWQSAEPKFIGSLRSSDFMPGHLKAFGKASEVAEWDKITEKTYSIFADIIKANAPNTGLVPDFIAFKEGAYSPAPRKFLEGPEDGHYSYNACRNPWRLATDYLMSGDKRALAILNPLNAWIKSSTGSDPDHINAGYELDGSPIKKDKSNAFLAPFAVSAMVNAENQEWLDALWAKLLSRDDVEQDVYYENSVKLMSMIVISGNWW